ncbi:MAG TPA: hypothetical protein VMB50_13475 [Myxococcales bacterium]|nr:hypothetical protein [Myxococcales bacterium]
MDTAPDLRGTRALATALLALASCATYPVVLPGAFVPVPRRLAVLRYTASSIAGGQFLFPVPLSDIVTPYVAFKQALALSGRFVVADDQAVAASPIYASQPTGGGGDHSAPPLRALRLHAAAAPLLARALGADLVLAVDHRLRVVGDDVLGPYGDRVEVWTRLEAYAPDGTLVWKDRFVTYSTAFASVLGMHDPSQLQTLASQAMAAADQDAVGRLAMALGAAAR